MRYYHRMRESGQPEEAERRQNDSRADRTKGALIRIAHRLLDALLGVDGQTVLNDGETLPKIPDPAAALKRSANAIRAAAFEESGDRVDYGSLKDSEAYQDFRRYTRSLPYCEPEDLGDVNQRTAFWINLYNALVLDAVICFEVQDTVREDLGFFRRAAYNVGGMRFSADDIEHGVLRGNRSHPMLPFPPFGADDPRLQFSLEDPDPRIHFTLVCGARSCPPISVYDGERLGEQLELAAANFIRQEGVQFESESNTLWLSRIFRWYRVDFGGEQGLRSFLARYLEESSAAEALTSDRSSIRYQEYDWSINALSGVGAAS